MQHARLILAFFAAAVIGAFVGCGTAPVKCSPASCSGCCDAAGACQAGASQSSCGGQGNGCVSCQAGTNCEFGVCRTSSTTGGGGGATGGGSGSTGGGGGSTTGGGTGGGAVTGGGSGGGATGGGAGGGATGGSGGGSPGGGAGGGNPTFDAGVIVRPDGGVLVPPTIQLTFMTDCGNVTSCAGNVVDAWAYTAGCIDDAAFARVTSGAMAIGCTAVISNKRGSIAGSAVFDGTLVHRSVVGQTNFHLSAGATCANPQVCAGISGFLPAGVTGSCSLIANVCECDLSIDIGQSGSQPYTYIGGVLQTEATSSTNPAETYESCITGSTLRYRETTTDGGSPTIPGVFTLTK